MRRFPAKPKLPIVVPPLLVSSVVDPTVFVTLTTVTLRSAIIMLMTMVAARLFA